MEHVLQVTIQGKMGFSSGYIWWMGTEEIVIWCREHVDIGDELRLRIDWAMGTALIDCKATIHGILPRALTDVNDGKAAFATYTLINEDEEELLFKGLILANPDLKAKGFSFLPYKLHGARRKAEHILGRKLGEGPGLGVMIASSPVKKPRTPKVPAASRRLTPPRMPKPRKRPATKMEEEKPEKAARAEGEFWDEKKPDDLEFAGIATPTGGNTTRRLRRMSELLRQRAIPMDELPPVSPAPKVESPPEIPVEEPVEEALEPEVSSGRGLLRISKFVKGPPHAALVRIKDAEKLFRAVSFQEDQIEFYLRKEAGIRLYDKVALLLYLPDGTTLEMEGRVSSGIPGGICLEIPAPSELALDTMRLLLES